MGIEKLLFYINSVVVIFSATMVITVRNPVQAALYLVLTFFACAGIWMLLEAEFLAIALVLVYVGAVMVLFLFVVMMLDINIARMREGFIKFLPVGIFFAVVMGLMMGVIVGPEYFGLEKVAEPTRHPAGYNNTGQLGLVLYSVYVYP
ncbi:MAG: NADH-quinone oxidoreductase subunit J, partial [Thioalkalispiraceae bacterium]